MAGKLKKGPSAGKTKKSGKKKGGRGMSTFLACLGGCGGKMPREEMDEITELDFRHHSLTEVPSDVFACECTLDTLYLDSNQLSELPRELFHCHGLHTLTLSDNELKSLPPAIAALTALRTLDVSKNNLSGIPDSIKNCREIRSVDASVNPLCRLPDGFTQLLLLTELFLNDTFLEYLPANFGRLVCLEVLELRENQLNTLPKSLARLSKLRRLDIGSNDFSQLPEVVGSLSGLTELWFDNNRVRSVAPFVGQLSQLSYLDGCNNRIDSLPDEIANCKMLSDLHLSGNHLKSLPERLSACSALQVLRLDDNALGELPADIGALSKLTELVVTQNDLEHLPSSIGLLRNLHTLHADDNVLTSVPSDIGSCCRLSVLTLASNRLQSLPPELGHLNSLKVLNVWDNSIRNLPVSFSKLKLMALWLSDNQAKPSVQLQTETDPLTGQKVLTCYMLPQQPSDRREEVLSKEKDEPFPMANWEEKHKARSIIKFSFDDTEHKTGAKLSRAPTPYPKELRALAKHARNLAGAGGGGKGAAAADDDDAAASTSGGSSRRESREAEAGGGGAPAAAEVRGRREMGLPGSEEKRRRSSSGSVAAAAAAGDGDEGKVQLVSGTDGSVKAEYQAAAASVQSTSEFGSQPVVRTATNMSPGSVVVGTPQALPQLDRSSGGHHAQVEEGLVAPPVEEGPPQLREARTILQSEAPGLNRSSGLSLSERAKSPASATASATSGEGSAGGILTPPGPASPVSDEDTPADLLAEALAIADDMAASSSPQKSPGADDPADRSSTDSGYCRPSHITSSLNDVSDQGSDLVSPVSSLPPETPTTSPSNTSAIKQTAFSYSNTNSSSNTPLQQSPLAKQTQYATSSSFSPAPQSPLSTPVNTEFQDVAASAAGAASIPSSQYAATPSSGGLYSSSSLADPHKGALGRFSPAVGHQPRPGSLALSSLAESGVLGDRPGYNNSTRPGSLAAPCNTLGIPPAPPARAVSAATGLNYSPTGYGASGTKGVASTGEATPPARQLFGRSTTDSPLLSGSFGAGKANTSGGGGLYTIQQDSPTSPVSTSFNSTPYSNGGESSTGQVLASANTSLPLQRTSSSGIPVSGSARYSTPPPAASSRIPMNKQISSSSLTEAGKGSNEPSSRIPSYSTQLSNKSLSSENGSKIPYYGSPESGIGGGGVSRIPSLSSTGRSNSNLSNKSFSQEQYKNYNNNTAPQNGKVEPSQETGMRVPSTGSSSFNTPPKDSRIPYAGPSPSYNNNSGIKSSIQPPSAGSYRTPPIKNTFSPNTNGSGIQAPGKVSSLPSPGYSSSIPTNRSTGIPTPGYSRSNSSLSNSDKESRIPAMNTSSGSFGKSNVSPASSIHSTMSGSMATSGKSVSRLPSSSPSPYSPNTSLESSTTSTSSSYKEYRAQSRLPNPSVAAYTSSHSNSNISGSNGGPGLSYKSSSSTGASPSAYSGAVHQAINTPGLPPLPAVTDGRRTSSSSLQQPKSGVGSRIPQFGGSASATTGQDLPQQQQQPPQPQPQQQQPAAPWMFGHHQNARVFPVVIEKNPGPGFTLTETAQPEKCVFVASVVRHGPASSALQPGDKLLQIDGEAISDVDQDTMDALAAPNGDTITLLVSRLH